MVTIPGQGSKLNRRVQTAENHFHQGQAGYHTVFFGQNIAGRDCARRHGAVGGQIAGAEVFPKTAFNQFLEFENVQFHVFSSFIEVIFDA
jgi:hypothetical protein